jgi:DNA-binding NarL/FixJ family response regulator
MYLRGKVPSTPTPRQMEVLRAVYREGTLKDAAIALRISLQTAKRHTHELYGRLGVENSREAAYALWLRDLPAFNTERERV